MIWPLVRRATTGLRLAGAVLSGLAVLSSAPAAHAADEPDSKAEPPTEVMVVSGSYAPQSAATIPIATTTIDGEVLDRTISLSLADALRFVPGLQLAVQGGRGGRAELRMRGLDPNHVVVLIDGIRLNDAANSRGGSFDPTTLALIDIERVEILRGPASAVYGSDGLAGAVNIITRTGLDSEPEASVRLRGGRFHEGQAIAQARGGVGDHVGLSVGAALDTFRDPNSDGGFDGASLKARFDGRLPFGIESMLTTRLHESSARGFPDSSGGPELAQVRAMEDRQVREWLIGARLRKAFEGGSLVELRASRTDRREDLDSPGIDIPPIGLPADRENPVTRSGDEYERWEISALGTFRAPEFEVFGLSQQTSLSTGVNVVWEDGENDTYLLLDFGGGPSFISQAFYDHRRTIGLFGELTHEIAEVVTLSASLRRDFVRGERDRLSPAAGASIAIPKTPLVLFGHYGEGFKLPSFYSLGRPVIGNPGLITETSRGWDIGVRATTEDGRLRVQATWFDLRVKELIDFQTSPPLLINRSRLNSRGVELEVSWSPLDAIDLRVGGTWNETRFGGSSVVPTNRPEWQGFAEVTGRPVESVELTLRAFLVSSSKATAFQVPGVVQTLHGYERFDFAARWQVLEWVALFGELQNLTDSTPREAIGFESPGISARAGVELRL